jgi:hypothetical protein
MEFMVLHGDECKDSNHSSSYKGKDLGISSSELGV